MKVQVEGGRCVTLRDREFVAEGGEGRVYARRETAYKVWTDPARRLASDKVAALRRIASPDVIAPQALLRAPGGGDVIGYTMRFVRDAWVLGQLVSPRFANAQGITTADALQIAERLARALRAVHAAGVLVVDLSDVNVLVDSTTARPALIDCDSWQTPGHPATAITPAITDPRAGGRWSEGSDWFSYAVLVFSMLVGIHPFRGKHPHVRGMAARMAQGLSVLDPQVRTPAVCRPRSIIPAPWLAWFREVLERGHRGPPPVDGVGLRSTLGATRVVPVRAGGVAAAMAHAFAASPLPGPQGSRGATAVPTAMLGAGATGPRGTEITLVTQAGVRVVATRSPGRPGVALQCDAIPVVPATLPLAVDAWHATPYGGVVARIGGELVELVARPLGPRLVVAPRPLARVLPHATQLLDGVAIVNALGRMHAHLLIGPGCSRVVRLEALDGRRVLDARFVGHTLQILAQDARGAGPTGRVDRWTFTFRAPLARASRDDPPDLQIAHDVDDRDLGDGRSRAA